MLVLALASLLVALAQEPAPPAPPAVEVEPLADRFVWEQRAPLPSDLAADSVAVSPSGDWLVLDRAGALFLTDDKGTSWRRVLAGRDLADEDVPGDEEILLEAEAIRDEELDDVSTEVGSETVEVGDVDVEVEVVDLDAANAVVEDVREEVTARIQHEAGAEDAPGVVWIHPGDPAIVLVGRPDGVWRSDDGGRVWTRTGELAASAFHLYGDVVFAGTARGVSWSANGGADWVDVEGAAGGRAVSQLAGDAGGRWAAGNAGLFRSADGLHWDAVEALAGTRVLGVTTDPSYAGGLWVVTPDGLQRSDDGGATFYSATRQPLAGLRRVVHLGQAGHLLAITGDGVWESVDNGLRWLPASSRLTDPDVRDLAFDGGLPVIATSKGTWRMIAPLLEATTGVTRPPLALYEAVKAAQSRVDIEPLSIARAGILATFAPKLVVTFDVDWLGNRDTRDDSLFAGDEDHDGDWGLQAELCWGNCSTVTTAFDGDFTDVAQAMGDEDLYVLDGEVYTDDQVVSAAANIAAAIRSYRSHVAQVVGDAWIARRRLAQEEEQVATLPLQARVDHALKVMEIDARLDAYTEGAWLGALHIPEEVR